jgi:hypothetical protein
MVESFEQSPMGPRKTKVARMRGERVKLNGSAVAFGKTAEYPIFYGYAVTEVDEDFWNEWYEKNKATNPLLNKDRPMIWVEKTEESIRAHAKDQMEAKIKSGLERLNPKDLPAEFKKKITTADATPSAAEGAY